MCSILLERIISSDLILIRLKKLRIESWYKCSLFFSFCSQHGSGPFLHQPALPQGKGPTVKMMKMKKRKNWSRYLTTPKNHYSQLALLPRKAANLPQRTPHNCCFILFPFDLLILVYDAISETELELLFKLWCLYQSLFVGCCWLFCSLLYTIEFCLQTFLS